MSTVDASIGNFAGGDGYGIGRTVFLALQASGTFFELYKRHNNQILMLKGKNKVRSALIKCFD
jgi:hypothetical protein